MAIYQVKPKTVDAVFFNPDGSYAKEIAEWAGGTVKIDSRSDGELITCVALPLFCIILPRRQQYIMPGYWIVRVENHIFREMTDNEFNAKYELGV